MNPLHAWNRFWFGPISARPLGVYRILFGLFVLAHLGLHQRRPRLLVYRRRTAPGKRGSRRRRSAAILATAMGARPRLGPVRDRRRRRGGLRFILGWRTRIMGILLYLGLLSLYHRNISSNCGPDQLMIISSFYLMLSPCGAAYSLDARRARPRRGTLAEPLILPWARSGSPDTALPHLLCHRRVQVHWNKLAGGNSPPLHPLQSRGRPVQHGVAGRLSRGHQHLHARPSRRVRAWRSCSGFARAGNGSPSWGSCCTRGSFPW